MVPGVKVYVPSPVFWAAEATVTGVPLSTAVLPCRQIEGGLAVVPEPQPDWQLETVGGAIRSEPAGNWLPPDGQPGVPPVQASRVA
jgi:hypothetical protein